VIAGLAEYIARTIVVAALVYAGILALTHWLVRQKRLSPFGAWPRFVRRIGDPVLVPLERRVVRRGGMPQDAPLWLLGIVVVGGLLLISLVRWVIDLGYGIAALSHAGPRVWLLQLVSAVFWALRLALIIRVIGSWLGASPFARWMRPVVAMTDWILEPLRRVLPPFGPLDLSPLVAWFLLWIAEQGLVLALQ
jgi:YggT family protein